MPKENERDCDFESIKYYINMYTELHGNEYTLDDIYNEIVEKYRCSYNDFVEKYKLIKKYDFKQSTANTNEKDEVQYGLFIGRCQPFHLGHQAVINEMMLDGKKPIIMLGSANKRDDRNPLHVYEREELIKIIFPNNEVDIIPLNDYDDWESWFNELYIRLNEITDPYNICLYYHNKEEDRQTFEYKDHIYNNEFYTKIFEIEGFKTKEIGFVDRTDFKIESNARDIRHDIEANKHFLDARIYWNLKNKGWK